MALLKPLPHASQRAHQHFIFTVCVKNLAAISHPLDLQASAPFLKNDRNDPLPGAGTVRREALDLQRLH